MSAAYELGEGFGMIDRRAVIAGAVAVLVAPAPRPMTRAAYMAPLYAKLRIEMEKIKREKAPAHG